MIKKVRRRSQVDDMLAQSISQIVEYDLMDDITDTIISQVIYCMFTIKPWSIQYVYKNFSDSCLKYVNKLYNKPTTYFRLKPKIDQKHRRYRDYRRWPSKLK